jgi:hypothetical protein
MAKKRAAAGQDAPAKKTVKKAAKAAKPATAKKKSAKAAKAAAPKKKAAAVKLNDKQRDLLLKVKNAGETGYKFDKSESRGLQGLKTKKLVKSGRDKETKQQLALLTKAGEKALASSPSA